MNIKYKVLNELAKVPTRGSEYAAGYDLYAATDEPMNILAHTTQLVKTGLAFELPDGYFGTIFATIARLFELHWLYFSVFPHRLPALKLSFYL